MLDKRAASTIKKNHQSSGFVLLSALFLIIVFLAFLLVYNDATRIDIVTTKSSKDSAIGFFAAEAGLNIRAEGIRSKFVGYGNTPEGSGPIVDGEVEPCEASNNGTGDLVCDVIDFAGRSVTTYLTQDLGNPYNIEIPMGERFQGLNAVESRYTAYSTARNKRDNIESILELTFRNRSIPLFQFAAFYDFDLEYHPGPTMVMNGPVHSNSNIYLSAVTSLTFQGQLTAGGDIIMGMKPGNGERCQGGNVFIWNQAGVPIQLNRCSGPLTKNDVAQFSGTVEFGVQPVDVPGSNFFEPQPGSHYWDSADLRLVLKLNSTSGLPDTTNSPSGIEVRNTDNTVNIPLTTALHDTAKCSGKIRSYFLSSRDNNPHLDDDPVALDLSNRVVGVTNTFYDRRQLSAPVQPTSRPLTILELDMTGLLNCIARQSDSNGDGLPDGGGTHILGESDLGVPKRLDEESDGGIVVFATVEGSRSGDAQSFYGIRARNGKTLQAVEVPDAPRVKGFTLITDQPFYVMGDYNSPNPVTERVAAAFFSDTFNVLSNSWCDESDWQSINVWDDNPGNPKCDLKALVNLNKRKAQLVTNIYSAVLSGTNVLSGGLHNYPRFHEAWETTFLYRGSLVSLNHPRHAIAGSNAGEIYGPPARDWGFDDYFKNYDLLPPATPTFSYLKQQLFERTFDR